MCMRSSIALLLACSTIAMWSSFSSLSDFGRSENGFFEFFDRIGRSSTSPIYHSTNSDDYTQEPSIGFCSGANTGMTDMPNQFYNMETADGGSMPWTPQVEHHRYGTTQSTFKTFATGNTGTMAQCNNHRSDSPSAVIRSTLLSECNKKAIVKTKYGSILGNVYDRHRSFLGIPYAVPPVGPNRWKKAIPLKSWVAGGVFDAREYGQHCMQLDTWGSDYIRNLIVGLKTEESEDCLNLNVYTPTKARLSKLPGGKNSKVPVMVFVHGGTFTTGGTSANIYDPSNFVARNDVIVVTFHYRMSIWGFLSSHELAEDSTEVGNYAVTDALAALQWVKTYISSFGGDPNNITLAGHSAGASLVNYLLLALANNEYRNLDLIHRVIMFSGSSGTCLVRFLDEADTDATQQPTFDVILRETGCIDADDRVECLRQVEAEELAQIGIKNKWEYHWGPVIDGYYFHGPPMEVVRDGHYYAVPMLVTDCLDDGTIFSTGEDTTTYDGYIKVIRKFFGTAAAPSIAAYYGPTTACDGTSYFKAASDLLRDALITCPLDHLSSSAVESGMLAKVWYFRFYKPLSVAWLVSALPGVPDYGVFHGTELVLLFQGLDELAFGQNHAINHVQRRIVSFMKGGEPNDPLYPKENPAKQLKRRLDIDDICSQWAHWPLDPEFIEVKMGLRSDVGSDYMTGSISKNALLHNKQ